MKKLIAVTLCVTFFCMTFAPLSGQAQFFNSPSEFNLSQNPALKDTRAAGKRFRDASEEKNFAALIAKAREKKSVSVIVGLNLNTAPEGYLNQNQKVRQRNSIKNMQNDLISGLSPFQSKVLAQYQYIPFIAARVNEDSLRFLEKSPLVLSVAEDRKNEISLAQSIPIIGADDAWNLGYTGDGQVVAIIDTGVDKNHSFLANKVVSEACYSQADFEYEGGFTENLCGGATDTTATDSGLPCGYGACDHGTHVAGIAAGNGTNSGVAKDADLIAIKVFTRYGIIHPGTGHVTSNIIATDIDILKGLERVLYLKNNTSLNISSVNISIGGGTYTSSCNTISSGAYETVINSLKSNGVATVISSGNNNSATGISAPACVDPAVSVGATNDGSTFQSIPATPVDGIWSYTGVSPAVGTNNADILDLLAPGAWITSSVPGGGFGTKWGTSMAAPHVAGAYAVIKERFPNASVDQILNALKQTGTLVTDTRSGANNRQKPRINVDLAIAYLEQVSSARFDFNGDGRTDISVFRPSDTNWYVRNDNGTYAGYTFGLSTDELVPADFTGDGRTEVAVWRPSTAVWYVLNTSTVTYSSFTYGATGDIPAPGDFDGDGNANAAVYRPSTGYWHIRNANGTTTSVQFGLSGDQPVVEDYDGDGKDDIAIFRPSNSQWWILRSSDNSSAAVQFGTSGDKTVQGDYTGDGKADVAVFRPSNGYWYILRSEDATYYAFPFGTSGDLPTPGDYDGDGLTDSAVFRPSESKWYILASFSGSYSVYFGTTGDVPIPNVYSVP